MGNDSFERFLREVRSALRALASRYPTREREDLFAVGVEAVWRAFEKGEENPRRAIGKARWAMIDYLRRVKPGSRRSDAWVPVSLTELFDKGFELRHRGPGVDDLVDQRLRQRALFRVLRKLPRRQRFVVRARLRGWKVAAIAARLGVTEPRVMQILTASTARLSALLAAERAARSEGALATRPEALPGSAPKARSRPRARARKRR